MSSIIPALALAGTALLPAAAQIIPDATLPQNSQVFPAGNLRQITGGSRSGTNLFHSFQQFSVLEGQTAHFDQNLAIVNIFSRVTGGLPSAIYGTLRANGSANLFFLNPAGIIFGPNAALDLGGSFLGTTAHSLQFSDGTIFSASAPTSPLLTVSVPVGLEFGPGSGKIEVDDEGHRLLASPSGIFPLLRQENPPGLQVRPGNTLALVGAEVVLEGGILTTNSGRVEVGAVQSGYLKLVPITSGWQLDYSNIASLGNIHLSRQSLIESFGFSGNSLQVQGADISVLDGSVVSLQNLGQFPDGTLNVRATGTLSIEGVGQGGTVRSGLLTEAVTSGQGGNLTVSAHQLRLAGGGAIATVAFGQGAAGNINILATDSARVTGFSPQFPGIFSTVSSTTFAAGRGGNLQLSAGQLIIESGGVLGTANFSFGQGGDIFLSTQQIAVQNGGSIAATSFGVATGGNLTIESGERVRVADFLARDPGVGLFPASPLSREILSSIVVTNYGTGRGGNLTVATPQLTIEGGGTIGSVTFGSGAGGNVSIDASRLIVIDGSTPVGIGSSLNAATFSAGKAGELNIETKILTVDRGGTINTATYSSGAAGNVNLRASEQVTVAEKPLNSGITTQISSAAIQLAPEIQQLFALPRVPSGNAGNVTLKTPTLTIANGGSVTVGNEGTGVGGAINIEAGRIVLQDGAGIVASTRSGQGGNISIQTGELQLDSDSEISARAGGSGQGGNIKLISPVIFLSDGSEISAETESGNGGNITLQATDINLANSQISTTAGGSGDGGNIGILTKYLFLFDNSRIAANAFQGRGGNITISTEGLFTSPDSRITASSQFGIDGQVELKVNAFQTNPSDTGLPINATSLEQVLTAACSAARKNSRFTVEGRLGMPASPDSRSSPYTLTDLAPLGEVIGVEKLEDGRVRLLSCDRLPSEARTEK